MPEPVRKAIMGHAEGSDAHTGYGERVSLRKRAEWVAKFDPLAGSYSSPPTWCRIEYLGLAAGLHTDALDCLAGLGGLLRVSGKVALARKLTMEDHARVGLRKALGVEVGGIGRMSLCLVLCCAREVGSYWMLCGRDLTASCRRTPVTGFGCRPIANVAARTGAGVRKPPGKEGAGLGHPAQRALWGIGWHWRVQQGAGAAGVGAANEWRRCDGRPNQRRERRMLGLFEVCCMGLIETEAEHRRCRTSTSSTAQQHCRVIEVQSAS